MITPNNEEIVQAMETYGGGFVKALAEAFRHADVHNYRKLQQAFPEYWKEYTDFAVKIKLRKE